MSEKPGKRLVGWKQYLSILGNKGLNYGLGTLCILVGCLFLLGVVSACVWAVFRGIVFGNLSMVLALGGTWGALGILTLWVGKSMYTRAGNMEPVTLITRHNIADLPAVETLVRASDLPPSHQQSELLRAAPQGSETPPEELLRATTNSNGEGTGGGGAA